MQGPKRKTVHRGDADDVDLGIQAARPVQRVESIRQPAGQGERLRTAAARLLAEPRAYVSQLDKGKDYELLQPVYSLNLVNDTFSDSKGYYHDFQIVEETETREVIEGLRFIFIELPKFTPDNYQGKKMQVLWLRYLTEINEKTREAPEELMENPEIKKAVTQLEESAFSKEQLLGYDHFWDVVSTAKMQISSSRREGLEEGRAEGLKEGEKIGIEKGAKKKAIEMAQSLKAKEVAISIIAECSGLSEEEINSL